MNIPDFSLKYSMRDPQTGMVHEYSPAELNKLLEQDRKPVLFCCSGGDSFTGMIAAEDQIRSMEGLLTRHSRDNYHLVRITSQQSLSADERQEYIQSYQAALMHKRAYEFERRQELYYSYEQPTDFGIRMFKDMFDHSIPELSSSDDKRAQQVTQTKRIFSRYNFFGYSFGTVVQAQLFDYTQQMLIERGFSPDETKECMQAMGKVHIGNSYRVSESHSHVPGVDFISYLDKTAQQYNPTPVINDSPVMGIQRASNDLMLMPLVGTEKVPAARMRYIGEETEKEKNEANKNHNERASQKENVEFITKLPRRKVKGDAFSEMEIEGRESRIAYVDPWHIDVGTIESKDTHALPLYVRFDQLLIDSDKGCALATSQAYPGAEVVNRYMQDLIESSHKASNSGVARNTLSLIDALQKDLTWHKRNDLGIALGESQKRFKRNFCENGNGQKR